MSEVKAVLENVDEGKTAGNATEPQPSIAVLPFVNMSSDKEQEYFSDGLAEEIINALTKIQGVKVIARTSAFAFKRKEQDIRKIAEALSVSYILEGSVRKSGNRLRINAQLITAIDGSHLWSERYDREMTDVFEIQDEICRAIVDNLRIKLAPGQTILQRHTENADAYNLLLKGRYHFYKLNPNSLAKSREHFEQAIALDESYALAWCRLARYYNVSGYLGFVPPRKAHDQAHRAVEKALKLDKSLAEAHAVLGILRAREYAWKESEQAFLRALELDPGSDDILQNYSIFLLWPTNQLNQALATSQKALKVDLLSPFHHIIVGDKFYFTRDYISAISHSQKALELDPQYYLAYHFIGLSYAQMEEFDKAIESLQSAVQFSSKAPLCLGGLGYSYALSGRIEEAQKLLMDLDSLSRNKYIMPISFAYIYTGLGKTDKALDWLEKGVDELDGQALNLKIEPIFDSLRSHPRYEALLRKMNLEP